MELFAGLGFIIILVAGMIWFRRPIAKTAYYAEEAIAACTTKGLADIMDQNRETAERIRAMDEVYLSSDLDLLIQQKCYSNKK